MLLLTRLVGNCLENKKLIPNQHESQINTSVLAYSEETIIVKHLLSLIK